MKKANFFVVGYGSETQTDFLLRFIHLNDFEVVFVTQGEQELGSLRRKRRNFGFMAQCFDAGRELYKHAKGRRAAHSAAHQVADFVGAEEALPSVWLKLLDAQRQAPVRRVDAQHNRLHHLTFTEHLRRILDPLGPRKVRDVYQSVHALLDLEEGAKIRKFTNTALDDATDAVTLTDSGPRVRFELLDS